MNFLGKDKGWGFITSQCVGNLGAVEECGKISCPKFSFNIKTNYLCVS